VRGREDLDFKPFGDLHDELPDLGKHGPVNAILDFVHKQDAALRASQGHTEPKEAIHAVTHGLDRNRVLTVLDAQAK